MTKSLNIGLKRRVIQKSSPWKTLGIDSWLLWSLEKNNYVFLNEIHYEFISSRFSQLERLCDTRGSCVYLATLCNPCHVAETMCFKSTPFGHTYRVVNHGKLHSWSIQFHTGIYGSSIPLLTPFRRGPFWTNGGPYGTRLWLIFLGPGSPNNGGPFWHATGQ